MDTSAITSRITKRGIQIALGLLWLLDGALQLQHQMFTSAFANNVIAPVGQGQPVIVANPIHWTASLVLTHPAIFDAGFAIIQLLIGFLILNKRTIRIGLTSSVVWGLTVWYFGEGLGGLLSWQTTLLMGAPGAALLYVILALAVIPKKADDQKPAYWLPLAWAILWIGGAILQLLPGQNSTAELSSMISGMSQGAPGWLASIDTHVAKVLHGRSFWLIIWLAVLQALIGLLVLFPDHARWLAVRVGILMSLIFWFTGQGLGRYYTGLATDPSTAPLFILLAVAILGSPQLPFKQLKRTATHDLEHLMI